MNDREPTLDVVVLGGGGHVGLPLSLAFAEAGLRVGIYDTNQATLDRIAAGEMPFMETGADELLRALLPTGRLTFGSDAAMIGRADQLVVVIGTPVDEFLGPSMTVFEKAVDQIAPHLRDGALVVLRSTVYPGTTAYVAPAPRRPRLHGRRRVLPRADRRGPCARGAPHAAPDRRRRRRPGRRARGRAVRRARRQDDPDDSTKEAELAKLFTNTWRYMKFAVANQFFMIADQAGVDYTQRPARDPRGLPARRGPARSGLRRRPVPVQGHDAARRVHRRTTSRSARRRCRSTRACRPTSCRRSNAATAGSRARPSASSGMAFKAESDDTRASLSYKLRKLLAWAGRARPRDRPVRRGRPARVARLRPRGERRPGPRRAAQGRTAGSQIGGKDVVDVWGALGEGIRL